MTLSVASFAGFSPDLLDFLSVLGRNNSGDWFSCHRDQYERVLLEPPPAELLSERLSDLCLTHFHKYRAILQWLVDLLPG